MATEDHRIRVWDAHVKKFLPDNSTGAATVTELAFDPLGQVIAFAVDATADTTGPRRRRSLSGAGSTTDRPGAPPGRVWRLQQADSKCASFACRW